MSLKTLDKRTRVMVLILVVVALIVLTIALLALFGNRGFKYGDAIDIGDYRYIYLGCKNFKEYRLGAVKQYAHITTHNPICETEQDLLELLSKELFGCEWEDVENKELAIKNLYLRFAINEELYESQKSSFVRGWRVVVLDTTKEVYDNIPDSVRGIPVVSMRGTFKLCRDLTTAPAIPDSVTDISYAFQFCNKLKAYIGNTGSTGDFSGYVIPKGVTNMEHAFQLCRLITVAPIIPEDVTNIESAFNGCASLVTAPVIPGNVTNMVSTFSNCTSLNGTIVINTNKVTTSEHLQDGSCRGCFSHVDMSDIVLTGEASEDILNLIGTTGDNWIPITNKITD